MSFVECSVPKLCRVSAYGPSAIHWDGGTIDVARVWSAQEPHERSNRLHGHKAPTGLALSQIVLYRRVD